ncbi:hypothetical protein [Actinoplanes utahensis]|uniref:Fibronectin type-III domain-containing protein n=1 Tax=Actinoplanes utahensis TaxID=1869 RepID=A0A0A6UM46_ACTUT|nr:hypothetical protein [Actinoplanes utahensis]KHD75369.1 hypothetical protein MB27_23335 [Actinoplanes utahensis]GIF33721.1 hypothetical protein Aut01nite_67070 [Actinoplanes utahensis]
MLDADPDLLPAPGAGVAPAPPARRGRIVIVPAVAVAVAVASVSALTSVTRPWETTPPEPVEVSPSAAAPIRAATIGLSLLDRGDMVTLRWDGAATSGFAPIVFTGRHQQEPRPVGQVPAGVGSYTVAGLNPDSDYCFAIGPGTTGPLDAVCTQRS